MVDSPFDPRPLRQARALLVEPAPRNGSLTSVAAAAALFATCALVLVAAVLSLPTPWPT
jgi:hypothetical protein